MSKDWSARYYQRYKDRIYKETHESYQNITEEEKSKLRIWFQTI